MLTYISEFNPGTKEVTAYDRVVGNAAALLLKKAFWSKVYSVVGSELAADTLRQLGIAYSFLSVVPYILNKTGDDLCPMEKASTGKSPGQFYQLVKERPVEGELL